MAIFFSTVVNEGFQAVLYKDGIAIEVLGPGRHRRRNGNYSSTHVDVRLNFQSISGQETYTADGAIARTTVIVRYQVVDCQKFLSVSANPLGLILEEARLVLRSAVAQRSVEAAMVERDVIAAEIFSDIHELASEFGVEIKKVSIRDIVPAGELRRAIGQKLTEKFVAQSNLERARGEIATLRSLANAARIVRENPGMAFLRAIQAAESGKASVVIGSELLGSMGMPTSPAAEPMEEAD